MPTASNLNIIPTSSKPGPKARTQNFAGKIHRTNKAKKVKIALARVSLSVRSIPMSCCFVLLRVEY